LRTALRGRRFDVLLHMQLALRASLYPRCIPAPLRLGFDRARARELQWLFTNRRIAARAMSTCSTASSWFTDALGIADRRLEWNLPLPPKRSSGRDSRFPTGSAR
jgi:heptosyltransferase I